MICGQNWHGGNNQNGCGHHFKKSEAPKYKPLKLHERKVNALDISKPKAETKHEIVEGTFKKKITKKLTPQKLKKTFSSICPYHNTDVYS